MIFLRRFRPDDALSIKLYALKKLEISAQPERRNVFHDLIKFPTCLIVYYFFQKRSIPISFDKAIKFVARHFGILVCN